MIWLYTFLISYITFELSEKEMGLASDSQQKSWGQSKFAKLLY